MSTLVLTPVEAGDGLAHQGMAVVAVSEAAATTMSPDAAGTVPSAVNNHSAADDQAHQALSAGMCEEQSGMTTSTGAIGNHAQGAIGAALEIFKAAAATPELNAVYPMHANPQDDVPQAASLAGLQEQQVPPTSSAQPLVSAASPADSMAAEGQAEAQDGSESHGGAMEVDMPQVAARLQTTREQPAFIQTSALIPNICGYCWTRQTSGCWRRGWDIGNGKSINLCNKCGLRHKAGKLHAVPGPTPPHSRRSTAHASPARGSSHTLQPGRTANGLSTAADREAVLASAAAAANAGLPQSSESLLVTVMGQQLLAEQHARIASCLTQPASSAVLPSSSSADRLHAAVAAEQQAATAREDAAAQEALLASVLTAAAAAVPEDGSKPDALSLMGPSGLAVSSATAAPHRGLPDFAAAAAAAAAASKTLGGLAGLDPSALPEGSIVSSASAQAVATLALAAGAGLDVGSIAPQLSGLSPEMAAYLSGIMVGDAPTPKRRRIKKPAVPGPGGPGVGGKGGRVSIQLQQLQRDDSLAAGAAADALLALNRSSASASPVGSPFGPQHDPAAAAANIMDAAVAAAAAGHAAAVADRETAAAVDAAAAAAGGWSPALEAFLAQPAGAKRGRTTAGATAAAGRAGSGRAVEPSGRQAAPSQVSSPGAGTPARAAALGWQTSTLAAPSPRSWSAEQLHAWLQGSNCGDAVGRFREQDVDGCTLAGMLRVSGGGQAAKLYELLRSELGMEHAGLRFRLVEHLLMAFGGH